jgi:hypothetical protein
MSFLVAAGTLTLTSNYIFLVFLLIIHGSNN